MRLLLCMPPLHFAVLAALAALGACASHSGHSGHSASQEAPVLHPAEPAPVADDTARRPPEAPPDAPVAEPAEASCVDDGAP